MKRKYVPDSEVIELSKNIISSFYNRDIKASINYLSDDFVWIGAYGFQHTYTKAEFLEVTQSEMNSLPFQMKNEKFILLSKNSPYYIVFASFNLIANEENQLILDTLTRLTIIWKLIDGELKLLHIHGSNPQDYPSRVNIPIQSTSHQDDFISYVSTFASRPFSEDKLCFKDTNGVYHYFSKNEILYFQADLQYTFIHTINNSSKIKTSLLEVSKKLPPFFYRIHKSYIININYLKSLSRYKARLVSGLELPVSKDKFMDFRNFLDDM